LLSPNLSVLGLQVKPYPVQADVIYSGGANTVQPGQVQLPQPLTNLLDIVSTSPLCVIEDFILKNSSVIHEKGILGNTRIQVCNALLSW